jgi:hypothetical protein
MRRIRSLRLQRVGRGLLIKMRLDITHRAILETGNDSFRFSQHRGGAQEEGGMTGIDPDLRRRP